ncbi:MAG: SDR family NAD(P)-dependent oxidoreductase [Megasphaera sp.]|jgi:short-subunit dehydrogenase|uniref:SDR family NAD(P)-dependent oxidoreductase n=1 Tax=Megasphaera sueciensis TaxID=349094 RepID=UPI003D045D75|nr:SDR family NAD(P)-dependent oxidoreductase [Megasphaera sp.]MCI1824240.1 SDR family NAD(P)-dependent oxidoreductase [Megasphaera sp.]
MRIALITGASSGLGHEFVMQIDQLRIVDEIWGIARSEEALDSLEKQIQTPFRSIMLDLTQRSSLEILQHIFDEERPVVDIVVNAAGFGRIGFGQDIPIFDSMAMIDLNCKAVVWITEMVIPYMASQGRILEICSASAFQPLPYLNVYAASKAFLYHYSCALHEELRNHDIMVTAVCPYWIKDTEFIKKAKKTEKKTYVTNYLFSLQGKTVVRQALKDSSLGRMTSVPGLISKAGLILSKIMTVRSSMKLWEFFRKL